MIIDCHGHYTTTPEPLGIYREAQKAAVKKDPRHIGEKGVISITDDQKSTSRSICARVSRDWGA